MLTHHVLVLGAHPKSLSETACQAILPPYSRHRPLRVSKGQWSLKCDVDSSCAGSPPKSLYKRTPKAYPSQPVKRLCLPTAAGHFGGHRNLRPKLTHHVLVLEASLKSLFQNRCATCFHPPTSIPSTSSCYTQTSALCHPACSITH
jgi:hypothetical protein